MGKNPYKQQTFGYIFFVGLTKLKRFFETSNFWSKKCCWDLDLHFNLHLVLDPRKIPQLHKFGSEKTAKTSL